MTIEIENVSVCPDGRANITCHRPPHLHVTLEVDCTAHPAMKAALDSFIGASRAALTEIFMGLVPEIPDTPPEPPKTFPCRICDATGPLNVEVAPGKWRCPDHAST